MKIIKHLVVFVIAVPFLFLSCKKDDSSEINPVTSITLCQESLSLTVGGREALLLTSDPEDVYLKLDWISSDTTTVKVDGTGVVYAIAEGNAIVTVKAAENVYDVCNIQITASPISQLLMPCATKPIAKDAVMIIEGEGFNENSKIWLYKMDNSSSLKTIGKNNGILVTKSAFHSISSGDAGILAIIYERNQNYISACLNASPGWYKVKLEENNVFYDFGNIEIAEVSIPEYQYNSTKIFWDDTHWRRYQLRNRVKELSVDETYLYKGNGYNEDSKQKCTYYFNKEGFLFKTRDDDYLDDKIYTTLYENFYDDKQRIVKQEITGLSSSRKVVLEYKYGSHGFYYPVNLRTGNFGKINSNDDNEIWVKGLTLIKQRDSFGESEITRIKEGANSIVSFDSVFYKDGTYLYSKYSYTYGGAFPIKMSEFDEGHDAELNLSYEFGYSRDYEFSLTGMPIKKTTKGTLGEYNSYQLDFVQNSPFFLKAKSSKNHSSTIYEYDNNCNQVSIKNIDGSTCKFYYLSYDDYGNWTQCKIINQSSDDLEMWTVLRDFIYW